MVYFKISIHSKGTDVSISSSFIILKAKKRGDIFKAVQMNTVSKRTISVLCNHSARGKLRAKKEMNLQKTRYWWIRAKSRQLLTVPAATVSLALIFDLFFWYTAWVVYDGQGQWSSHWTCNFTNVKPTVSKNKPFSQFSFKFADKFVSTDSF